MIKRMAVLCASVVGLLAGCANTQWYNPNYSVGDAELMANQKAIDEGYCTQVAHGAAPMPEARVYLPTQHNYSISGTISSYGSGGYQTSNYTGYVTPSPGASFSSGLVQGAALGAAIRARRAQDRIMKGCMLKLGWSDKPIAQQAATTPKQSSDSDTIPNQITAGIPKDQEDANITCSEWANDIARVIDSGYVNGVDKKIQNQLASQYLHEVNGSGRQFLIFSYLINARYTLSLDEMPSEKYPKFVMWLCENDWAEIGLGQS